MRASWDGGCTALIVLQGTKLWLECAEYRQAGSTEWVRVVGNWLRSGYFFRKWPPHRCQRRAVGCCLSRRGRCCTQHHEARAAYALLRDAWGRICVPCPVPLHPTLLRGPRCTQAHVTA